ncbi:MAG: L,D-transpeptidase [Fibrobacteres bacterium]|nr:L,D-transpeptidase [Fibrobacterota bacterium]
MSDKKVILIGSAAVGLVLAVAMMIFSYDICRLAERIIADSSSIKISDKKITDVSKIEMKKLLDAISALEKRLDKFTPAEHYLIINSADNVFTMKKGKKVERKGLCSTGSYVMLKSHGDREWIFKTPRGLYRILAKKESPVWSMPDWAFIEEGKPVPPPGAPERYEQGVLGDYALSLGNGYMIHGTLYQRFLGLPVSHGCIRLGDDDLEYVYQNMRIGSKVYLY